MSTVEVFWKIEEVHTNSTQIEKFYHCRTTDIFDASTRFRLELLADIHDLFTYRLLEFRQYFSESSEDAYLTSPTHYPRLIVLSDYFEDEHQQRLSRSESFHRLFNTPRDAMWFSGSRAPHDVELAVCLANRDDPFAPVDRVLTQEEVRLFRKFIDDSKELSSCQIMTHQSPFSLQYVGLDGTGTLRMIDLASIAHFVIVIRRLTAQREHSNILRIANLLWQIAPQAPAIHWIARERSCYNDLLSSKATRAFLNRKELPFTNRDLFEIFLNSEFAHPGTAEDEERKREMATFAGSSDALKFLFLSLAQDIAAKLVNVGRVLEGFVSSLSHQAPQTPVVSFKGVGQVVQKEKLLSDRDKEIFERTVIRYAEALQLATPFESLYDCLEAARKNLREVI